MGCILTSSKFFFCKLTSSIFLKKNSKKFVNRNENVVPLQMYSGGENRAQRPMHKFSSAD